MEQDTEDYPAWKRRWTREKAFDSEFDGFEADYQDLQLKYKSADPAQFTVVVEYCLRPLDVKILEASTHQMQTAFDEYNAVSVATPAGSMVTH